MINRYIFIIIFFISSLFATNLKIKQFQNSFYDEVLQINIYKKYFPTYFKQVCEDDNIRCIKDLIENISLWDSTQSNLSLQNELKYRKQSTYLSKKYFNNLEQKVRLKLKDKNIRNMQFISIVDLNRQIFIVVLYDIYKDIFYKIGVDLISAGDINREIEVKKGEDHYLKTPEGVFSINNGWRSEGKLNLDNRTLGYGEKGRFIYYLGKQKTIRYNTFDKNGTKIYDKSKWKLITDDINLAIHSHKSTAKMGKAYSHGCIRMSDEMNSFLDNNLVMHKKFFKNDKWRLKYTDQPLTLENRDIAGEYIIIFDEI